MELTLKQIEAINDFIDTIEITNYEKEFLREHLKKIAIIIPEE